MPNDTRRGFLGLIGAAVACTAVRGFAIPAFALDTTQARDFIAESLDQVYAVINSGKAPDAMYRDFETIFARYADVDTIARSALGPAARAASAQEFAAYRQAFQGYIGRKYGKRFREFIGSRIEVQEARPLKSFFAVNSVAYLNGRSPMLVEWHVSDKSGQLRYFNIIIEGINMLSTERTEITARLRAAGGDLGALTADLSRAG